MLSGPNAGFLRPDAGLTIIALTDAEDQSLNFAKDQFVSFVRGLKSDPTLVTMHGLLATQESGSCDMDANDPPTGILAAISELRGRAFSLCAPNYADNIQAIAAAITAGVDKSADPVLAEPLTNVHLPLTPMFDTIRVSYGWQILPPNNATTGWSYDWTTNEIVFGKDIVWTRQPVGTPLTITFVPTTK